MKRNMVYFIIDSASFITPLPVCFWIRAEKNANWGKDMDGKAAEVGKLRTINSGRFRGTIGVKFTFGLRLYLWCLLVQDARQLPPRSIHSFG